MFLFDYGCTLRGDVFLLFVELFVQKRSVPPRVRSFYS